MLNRNIKITFRLCKSECEQLKKCVKKSGMSQESYLRHLISGYVPAELPPPDYHSMVDKLRAIGNNMNQIAQKAHVLNVIDSQRYDDAFALLKQSLVEIVRAVTLPRKIERKRE